MYVSSAIKYILEKLSLLHNGNTNIDKQNNKLKSAGGNGAIHSLENHRDVF